LHVLTQLPLNAALRLLGGGAAVVRSRLFGAVIVNDVAVLRYCSMFAVGIRCVLLYVRILVLRVFMTLIIGTIC
jgi:hypothetical protein